ncbi:MAG TPA: tetratricopeptide repeat protein [Planctomycetota bacterium]|nr:tetratricopeptide repeat protein [Planctomycetota bacterium]
MESAAEPLKRGWTWYQTWRESWSSVLILIGLSWLLYDSNKTVFVLDDVLLTRHPPAPLDFSPSALVSQYGIRHLVALSFSFSQWLTPITPGWTGMAPWGYRLFNTAVHLGAALALFGIVRRVLSRARFAGSIGFYAEHVARIAAIIFLIHPLQTQSVTYISQRAQSMMGFFQLLALYCVVRGYFSPRRWMWYLASVVATLCALDCKPHIILAPVVVLLFDRAFLSNAWREVWTWNRSLHLMYAAVWMGIGIVAFRLRDMSDIGSVGILGAANGGMSVWQYLSSQPEIICHYLWLSVWPQNLCIDYAWPLPVVTGPVYFYGGIVVLMLGATAWACVQRPALGFVGAWFFLNLAASSSFIPRPDLCVEHRMYLPLISVIALLVVLYFLAIKHWLHSSDEPTFFQRVILQHVMNIFLWAVLACLLVRTADRNEDYSNILLMWDATVRVAPDNSRAQNNFANALAEAGYYKDAARHYEISLKLRPDAADVHYNLANLYTDLRRNEEAVEQYRKALKIDPEFAAAHCNLANVLVNMKRYDEAIVEAREALKRQPDLPNAFYIIGNAELAKHRFAPAVESYERAIALKPDYSYAHERLAVALVYLRRVDEAMRHLERALELKPDFPGAKDKLDALRRLTRAH